MCAKHRTLTVDESNQIMSSPSEMQESFNDNDNVQTTTMDQSFNDNDNVQIATMDQSVKNNGNGQSASMDQNFNQASLGKISRDVQLVKQSPMRCSSRASSVRSGASSIITSSSGSSERSGDYQLRMSKMPGKRPRTRSNAGLSDPQRLALIQGLNASHPTPPLPPMYKKESSIEQQVRTDPVEELDNPRTLTRTRTIGRGWTMCSMLPDAHSIDEDTAISSEDKSEKGNESDDESSSEEEIASRAAVSRTNTLLERVLSDIIHDRPEKLFEDLQEQQSPNSIESDPMTKEINTSQDSETQLKRKITRLNTFGNCKIEPSEWRDCILAISKPDSKMESYETRAMGRSAQETTYDSNELHSGNELEIPRGHETVSRDSVMRAISTASHRASIEWEDVQRINRRITYDEDLQEKRRSALSTISGSLSDSERTESSATIEILERRNFRARQTPIRSATTIVEVDSDEARDFLNGGQQINSYAPRANLNSGPFQASPSAFSSTSSSNTASSIEEKEIKHDTTAPLQRSAKEEYRNARQALKCNTILLDRAIDAKPVPRSAPVQTSPVELQMNRHTYYRPLRRAVQRSSCSKFWSPSSRTSLRVLSQQVPRVVVVPEIQVSQEGYDKESSPNKGLKEEGSKEEDNSDSEDESESESESEAETEIIRKLPPPPRTPDDKIVRFYNKPNYRATIYPRQVDEFFKDQTLHQAIQERLLALFLGQPFREQNLRVPLGGGKRTSRIGANFSRRFSERHLSVAMVMPPPQRPLPAVPVDVSMPNSPHTCDDDLCSNCKAGSPCSVCSGCLDSSCDVERATSRDDRNVRLSVISMKKKMRRRKTYVLGRDPLRDSWITETESMTSYCSWVSLISGDHSISSSSSCPRHSLSSPKQIGNGLIAGSHRCKSKRKSHLLLTSGDSKEAMLSEPDLLNSATHPPSSSILPAHWTGEWMERGGDIAKKSQKNENGLPNVQILSPFSLDPHHFWPDNESATPALEKWKRYKDEQEKTPKATESFADKVSKRLTMNIHRLSLQSISSSDTIHMEGHLDSPSSSGSSTVMTPPRAEFLQTGLESPGKRISQVLSPFQARSMVTKTQAEPVINLANAIPRLRNSNAPTPTVPAPKHKRWIIIDANGKRITGGDIRDSGSTWHSKTQDEVENATTDNFFDSYSSDLSSEDADAATGVKCNVSGPASSFPDRFQMTQSPEPIQAAEPEDAVVLSSTRRSVLFSPTTGRPITLEPEQVRSILMKRRSNTGPIGENGKYRRSNAGSSTGRSSSDKSMSIRFADKAGVRKMSSISERVSNASSTNTSLRQQNKNLFAPPLPPAIPLPALPQPKAVRMPTQEQSESFQPDLVSTTIPVHLKENAPFQVQQRSQSLPMEDRPKAQRSDTYGSSKSSKVSKARLTRADLSERIQREEVRIKRNDERLSALDKLEGKKQKSQILANLIKSTSNGIAPDSMQTDAGHSDNLTKAIEKARKEKTKGKTSSDGQNIQTIIEEVTDEEDIATTPLTPFREQLRKMEHEWEVRHHVKEYAPIEAQKFTNVTGFDVGIVPFGDVGSKQETKDSIGRVKGGMRIMKRGKRTKPKGNVSEIKQSPPAYTVGNHPVPTIEIKPPTETFIMDKALERDLHAGLRKLSSVVEARQRAKERCVDK